MLRLNIILVTAVFREISVTDCTLKTENVMRCVKNNRNTQALINIYNTFRCIINAFITKAMHLDSFRHWHSIRITELSFLSARPSSNHTIFAT